MRISLGLLLATATLGNKFLGCACAPTQETCSDHDEYGGAASNQIAMASHPLAPASVPTRLTDMPGTPSLCAWNATATPPKNWPTRVITRANVTLPMAVTCVAQRRATPDINTREMRADASRQECELSQRMRAHGAACGISRNTVERRQIRYG